MPEDPITRFEGRLMSLPRLLHADGFLAWRGRHLSCEAMLEAEGRPYYLPIREGRLGEILRGPALLRSWQFCLRAPAEAWLAHWQPMPRPGFHDIFAMSKAGHLRIEGDLRPLMANLQYVKDLLALPRSLDAGDAP